MPPADADLLLRAVNDALELTPADRPAFLREACGNNQTLFAEAQSILAHDESAGDFLQTPAFSVDALDAGELPPGASLGDCRIIRLLGEGGMGEVYLARDVGLERDVAVKLLKGRLNDESLLRSFRHERRILAGLTHPNIARLYGGAISPDGRPYLVMEYVEGERLDAFCRSRNLDVPARLALFRKACAAVTYAHQNLVVHRDLKPANIRVTPEGEPKLLDFGIAKLLSPESTHAQADLTVTMFGALTPEYASPEQLKGEPITTATDVYSLGVILYELLTGQRPYSGETLRRPGELARAICEQAPVRPSTLVARPGAALAGHGEPAARLRRRLAGDLDNIVAMALRKEPTRRYAGVAQLSEDIRCHLEGLPVMARKDTLVYRATKFVRRNKALTAAVSLVFLSLLAGVVATTRQAARADRRFNDVRRLAGSILFEVDPLMANLPGSIALRKVLVQRALEYLDRLSREAGDDRTLARDLATAYEKVGDVQGNPGSANLGDVHGALVSYGKARELREGMVRADPRDGWERHELATNLEQTGYILWWTNQTDRAERADADALALRTGLLAEQPRSTDYRAGMASLQSKMGDIPAWNAETAKALAHYAVALPLLRALAAERPGSDDAQIAVARCLRRIGDSRKDSDDYDGALAELSEAQGIVEPVLRRNPAQYNAGSELWFILFKRCELFLQQGANDQAVAIGSRLIPLAEDMVRREPQDIEAQHKLANSHNYLGAAYLNLKRYPEAIATFSKALEIDSALAEKSPQTATFQRSCADHRIGIGKAQLHLGRLPEAMANEEAARATLDTALQADGGDQMIRRDLGDVYQQIGLIAAAQNRPAEATAAFTQSATHWEALAADHPLNRSDAAVLAEVREQLGKR